MEVNKRVYGSWNEFWGDVHFLIKNRRKIRRVMRGGLVSPAFRERLMLTVTAVNACTYCSWAHAREALRSGVEQGEIAELLIGSVDNCPKDEAIAVLYAQHWADSDAKPGPESVRRLEQAYGKEKAEAVNLVLRLIRVGNLAGNSWGRFLYRISFGRWGK